MILPRLPDLTLLRLLAGKVRDPVLGLGPYSLSSSSDSKSESWSDPWLPPELRSEVLSSSFSSFLPLPCIDVDFYFEAMLKRISLKKLAKKVEKSKDASSLATSTSTAGETS